jgi:fibronectin type 3 domain-containing protein
MSGIPRGSSIESAKNILPVRCRNRKSGALVSTLLILDGGVMSKSLINSVRKTFGRLGGCAATAKRRPALSSMLEGLESRTLMSVSAFHLGNVRLTDSHHASDSHTAVKATTLTAPSALHASVLSTSSVKVSWTDNDSTATGYYVLRTTDGVTWTTVGTLTSVTANSYTDGTVVAGHGYGYEVKAFNSTLVSAASNIETLRVPTPAPLAPSALTATVQGLTVQLQWTDKDSTAIGYNVLRATDGVHFSQIGKLASGTAKSYTDTSIAGAQTYSYAVQAFTASATSAVSNIAVVATQLGAPSGLKDTHNTSSVNLTWKDNDSSAKGYYVLRATDGTNFSTIGTLNSASAAGYTDTTVTSGHAYQYEVKAFNGTATSAASNVDYVVTPLLTPTGLTATVSGATINLQWTGHDTTATGYAIFRATDGKTFTVLKSLTDGSANTYTDSGVTAGQVYTYEVRAISAASYSEPSNTASATVPSGGGGGGSAGVTITTRYGNELVITAGGAADTVSVVQSGSTLTIVADGKTSTASVPAAGIFVYARSGSDTITIDSSVLIRTTVDAIDGALTTIASAGANVSAWIDSTDAFTGAGVVHRVASFVGGVGKGLGLSMANPTDAGTTTLVNRSLWGTGPVAGDVNQGSVGDCYFLSTLAAFAGTKPAALQESAVDLGDGTFAVQYFKQGVANFLRVSNAFSTGGFAGFAYAHPGANNTIWAMVMEKAFASFRTGANTYSSIGGGWMGEVYNDLNTANTSFYMSTQNETAFYNMVSSGLSTGKPVTFGTSDATALVKGHAYTLVSASMDSNGVTHYMVRNPWGVSGDALENSSGYATLTFAQMVADFAAGCIAV